MNAELSREDWLGASSWSIDMSFSRDEIEAMENIDEKLNYTSVKDDPIYKNISKNYVSYSAEDKRHLLGYENTPEFYGVLPLIKI